MIKKLMNLHGAQMLSKEEQKELKGGTHYACGCFGMAGAWTGNYSGQGAADNLVKRFCRYGGQCVEQRSVEK